MEHQLSFVAKTFSGLENVLAKEIIELGGQNVKATKRAVVFNGDKKLLYKTNLFCRTALRILYKIKVFPLRRTDDLYDNVLNISWPSFFDNNQSFVVKSTSQHPLFNNSMFVSLRVKDAIVDCFRKHTGSRPDVDSDNPDIIVNVHISKTNCTISLDSSGDSLHKRGYRVSHSKASLNEVLAAGMILLSGWNDDCDFIDPMCGSATLSIEAALIAKNIPPGIYRRLFAFEIWNDFDPELLTELTESFDEKEIKHKIIASDISKRVLLSANKNIKNAGLLDDIELKGQDFFHIRNIENPSLFIMNPPYGERVHVENIFELYSSIGEYLKHQLHGHTAWILSYDEKHFHKIGLRPSEKHRLYNGPLECQFRKYEMYKGSKKKKKNNTIINESDKKD